ncbi:PepSY-associated TM helix [Planctomycetes bacterium Pan216]|uniref:PepSY-associated TM helix n=1 Tax=Kolteria novifilia TaxID=2527975 RepID=A0A518B4T5_9BACT|nr:PepSY-associated TM helix [Planctomycetes bacterium Pan216]
MTTRETPSAGANERKVENSYRTLWRWHFYAGLILAPMLLWAAVTGAIYIFADEVEQVLYRSMLYVESGASRRTLDELRDIAEAAFPEEHVSSVLVKGEEDGHAVIFSMHAEGQGTRYVYLDPYTGATLGSRMRDESFFPIVRQLHRNLYLGMTGRILMELATSWGIILLVTGIYLWWPRRKKQGRDSGGVWWPRWRSGTRVVLRDLHAVFGMYLMPAALVILATGLFFSQVWGRGYLTALVVSGNAPDAFFNPPHSKNPNSAPPLSLQQAYETAKAHDPGLSISISPPHDEEEGYGVGAGSADVPHRRSISVLDQYSGEVLTRTDMTNASPMLKVLSYAYPLHVGSIFGLPTKLLALMTCLVIIISTVSGVWMWWRARPRGSIGVPRRGQDRSANRWFVLLLCGTGVLLPVAGASMVLFFAIDQLITRVPRHFRRATTKSPDR